MVGQALDQSWPPFVLVAGLLMVGVVAHADGLFVAAGGMLERVPGGAAALYAGSLLVVAAVTAVLNLDTAVLFVTPVLVLAARRRGLAEEPFLYASVFMANASSLFLPGSNLTNLIVLEQDPISGGGFARAFFPPAAAAALVTGLALYAIYRGRLRTHGPARLDRDRPGAPRASSMVAVAAVAVITVALPEPALPVFAVGLVVALSALARGRVSKRELTSGVGLVTLGALFLGAVALGTLARAWDGPAHLVAGAGRIETAVAGAVGSVALNNLPASVLLSAQQIPHPRALLIGLNIGPNLAVSGSLSAVLWFRAARQVGARPSAAAFSRRGMLLAPLALVAALATAALFGPTP